MKPMGLNIGDLLPPLTLASGSGDVKLQNYHGKKLVIYFYPKDNTPGCTIEGQEFSLLHSQFQAAGTEIVGISKDSVQSHEKFIRKFGFPFALLSDADGAACKAFGVIKEKSLYGRTFLGINRSTFLFDEEGILRNAWHSVKVKGHANEVLEAVRRI